MVLDHGAVGLRTLLANALSRLGVLLPQTEVTFRPLHGGLQRYEFLNVCESDGAAVVFSVLIKYAETFSPPHQPEANSQPFHSGLPLGVTFLPSITFFPL